MVESNDTVTQTPSMPVIPASDTPEALGFERQEMTRWFQPLRLVEIGVKVVVSGLFGNFADKREMQAVLNGAGDHSYRSVDELWFDYTADLGDGWNSTYTVSKVLAEPSLDVNDSAGASHVTERGRFLVMGGDQVYPLASRDGYRNRTEAPYRCALPWVHGEGYPHLYALPGNHDWYDGLTSFTRLFCQNRWIGAWKTQQRASYFAIALPHNWWLFAADVQLGADIDKPQLDYFDSVIDRMQAGDRVILVTASPTWILDYISGGKQQENLAFLEKRIQKKQGIIFLNVAGDLHHYAHYTNAENTRHKITAGGGGAFLHGTHVLPAVIDVNEASGKNRYTMDDAAVFPDRKTSKGLIKGNLLFAIRNWETALFLGLLYLFTGWVTQNASLTLGGNLLASLVELDLSSVQVVDIAKLFAGVLANSVSSTVIFVLYLLGAIAFCAPFPDINAKKMMAQKISLGALHGLGHLVLMVVLLVGLVKFNVLCLGMMIGSYAQAFALMFEMLIFGSLCAGTFMGLYLYVTTLIFKAHVEAGFSGNRIEDYKNFLRFHISRNGDLTVYPIGIEKIETRWRLNTTGKPGDTWFVPENGRSMQSYAHLIESPITIHADN